ncbi:hypothetical protein QTO34_002150, partial [Cnephaeus nilssonii]
MDSSKRSKSKPINYSKLTTISQEANENPSAFLERLREALVKQTNIRRKLQKLAMGPESNLDNLLKVTTSVFCNRDQEEEDRKDRRSQAKTKALCAVLQESMGPSQSLEAN